eukprot:scaffold82641_cov30-Phaeocystis_antarctica.AAC.1
MQTSRPVGARLLADGEDPGLQSELGAEYTRPNGGCYEHAARFDRTCTIGEGPGLISLHFKSFCPTQGCTIPAGEARKPKLHTVAEARCISRKAKRLGLLA